MDVAGRYVNAEPALIGRRSEISVRVRHSAYLPAMWRVLLTVYGRSAPTSANFEKQVAAAGSIARQVSLGMTTLSGGISNIGAGARRLVAVS